MEFNWKVKAGSFMLIFAAILLGVVSEKTAAFDLSASNLAYSLRTPLLTEIMFGATFLGSTPFISALAIIVFLFLWIKNRKKNALLLLAAILSSVAINNILKYYIHRHRPDISPLENSTFYSFPSGHSMNAFVFYGLLTYFAHHSIKNKSLLITIDCAMALLVATIGFSRIYLGAHYPTDVIAGFSAGACVLIAAIAIDRKSCYNMSVNKNNHTDNDH